MNGRASKSSALIIQEVLQVKTTLVRQVHSVACSGLKEGTFHDAAVQRFQQRSVLTQPFHMKCRRADFIHIFLNKKLIQSSVARAAFNSCEISRYSCFYSSRVRW